MNIRVESTLEVCSTTREHRLVRGYKQEDYVKRLVGEMTVQGENNMMRTPKHSRVFFEVVNEECSFCKSRLGFLYPKNMPPVCMNCSMEKQSS